MDQNFYAWGERSSYYNNVDLLVSSKDIRNFISYINRSLLIVVFSIGAKRSIALLSSPLYSNSPLENSKLNHDFSIELLGLYLHENTITIDE